MTDAEKLKKLQEYLHDFGWYPILILDMDDVKERLKDYVEEELDEDRIRKACLYVANNMDIDYSFPIEWASDLYLIKGKIDE